MSNNLNLKIMEAKVIIVSVVKSNKSDNMIYQVAITGEEKAQGFCKSPYKAMRLAFMLKKRTGFNISENCLARLSNEIKGIKMAKAAELKEKVAEIAEKHSVDKVLEQQPAEPKAEQPEKPKKQRKPRTKKSQQVVAQ